MRSPPNRCSTSTSCICSFMSRMCRSAMSNSRLEVSCKWSSRLRSSSPKARTICPDVGSASMAKACGVLGQSTCAISSPRSVLTIACWPRANDAPAAASNSPRWRMDPCRTMYFIGTPPVVALSIVSLMPFLDLFALQSKLKRSHVQLHHVLVVQNVLTPDRLAIEDAGAPDARRLEPLDEVLVNPARELVHRAADGQREGRFHVGRLSRRFRVNPHHVQPAIECRTQLFEPGTVQRG